MKIIISLLGSLAQDYVNTAFQMGEFLEFAKYRYELRHFWIQGRLHICKAEEAEDEVRGLGSTNRGEYEQYDYKSD